MARKTSAEELAIFLRSRYCYTFIVTAPNAVPINVAVLADNDDSAKELVKKTYNNPGTEHDLIARAATILTIHQ
jgi:hypothetical protein